MSTRYKLAVSAIVPSEEPSLSLPAKEALYRIGMEALQNAVKHAQATHIQVNLRPERNIWALDIRDNGRGFDPDQSYDGHYGLNTMRERANQMGAVLNITSQPGVGSIVSVQVPGLQSEGAEAFENADE